MKTDICVNRVIDFVYPLIFFSNWLQKCQNKELWLEKWKAKVNNSVHANINAWQINEASWFQFLATISHLLRYHYTKTLLLDHFAYIYPSSYEYFYYFHIFTFLYFKTFVQKDAIYLNHRCRLFGQEVSF